uniref:Myc-associated zinc finger protein n=1 Tax=Cynoglossus semilaevis TaxID=244447 RepID=A0A3P8VM39_CYNSE
MLSAAYITDHMRVHNQSQHHACHLCNRSFTTLTYLRVHAQKHHGAGGVLLCQLCGVQCKTATQLQGHMGTHRRPSPLFFLPPVPPPTPPPPLPRQ